MENNIDYSTLLGYTGPKQRKFIEWATQENNRGYEFLSSVVNRSDDEDDDIPYEYYVETSDNDEDSRF